MCYLHTNVACETDMWTAMGLAHHSNDSNLQREKSEKSQIETSISNKVKKDKELYLSRESTKAEGQTKLESAVTKPDRDKLGFQLTDVLH